MQNKNIRRIIYRIKNDFVTRDNAVLGIAVVISISWAWSSVEVIQRNFTLQRELDEKRRQQKILELQSKNLEYEQRYYKSREYLTVEAKRRLGLIEPGERVIVLPTNSEHIKALDARYESSSVNQQNTRPEPSPFEQWMDFLFGSKPKT